MMSSAFRPRVSITCVYAFALAACATELRGQAPPSVGFVDIRSETDAYLRVLQVVGDVPLYPWSIRAFSPRERDRLSTTSAAQRWLRSETTHDASGATFWQMLPLQTRAVYNSAIPYGINDGAIWAGRGLTTALVGGIAARRGGLSLQIEPMVFHAQNQSFETQPTGRAGAGAFANPFYQFIDLPQRFGDRGYARFDPGNSTVRFDAAWFTAAVSTANQFWGPAIEHPIILGDNAAGFPHAYAGTAYPIDVRIGHVHGRIVWGRLDQSAASPQEGLGSRRFMSGVVGVFTPKGLPGLELGVTRFFHNPWPEDGFLNARFFQPFSAVFKYAFSRVDNQTGTDTLDNQLASVFARWVFPGAGVEIYGEYGKEDHNANSRDLWQEPDHDAAFLIGIQRAWRRGPSRLVALRGELLNSRISHLDQIRPQVALYVHPGGINQGHTELGQLLGSAGGYGGGAAMLALESLTPTGRWTVRMSRLMRAERRSGGDRGLPIYDMADVMQTLGVERVMVLPRFEFSAGATGVVELNRDFKRDVFNMNLTAALKAHW